MQVVLLFFEGWCSKGSWGDDSAVPTLARQANSFKIFLRVKHEVKDLAANVNLVIPHKSIRDVTAQSSTSRLC